MPTDLMNVIDRLRPEPPQLDAEWSARELDQILATPPRRRRRRWTIPVAVGVGAAVLAGGAYGGGFLPDAVVDRLGSGDQSDPISQIGQVREVFDVRLHDGRRTQLFMAPNKAGGECWTMTFDLSSDAEPDDLSYTCAADYGFEPPGDGIGIEQLTETGPAIRWWILYGLRGDGFAFPPATQSVRVTGPDFERYVEVDGPEGWAVELPEVGGTTRFQVDFLDAEGRVLHTAATTVRP